MNSTGTSVCAMVALITLTVATGALASAGPKAEGSPVSQPSSDDVSKAIAQLTSSEPSSIVAAVQIISRTGNTEAWGRLRAALSSPEVLNHLEVPSKSPRKEGGGYQSTYPDLAKVLGVVAGSEGQNGPGLLMWLAEQKVYTEEYREDGKRWRLYLVFDAFQYIRCPSQKLLGFYREKFKQKTLDEAVKNRIMEALAAHGTSDSMALFETHLWRYGKPILLVKHRNNYECVRLLFSLYRGATNAKVAHRMLHQLLLEDRYMVSKFAEPVVLPKIEPRGDEATKFAKLLKGFVTNHGKIPLNASEVKRIEELVESIRDAAVSQSSAGQTQKANER